MLTSLERNARDERIIAFIQAHPELTYGQIGKRFHLSRSSIGTIARKAGLRRDGVRHDNRSHKAKEHSYVSELYAARQRAPKCDICTILTERIDDGVAIVRVGNEEKRACQDCVGRYGLEVVRWERAPVEMAPAEHTRMAGDIATARWPILEVTE